LVIHKDKESFLVVPLLALKMKKDLSEIAGWVGFTKPSQERHGSLWALLELSQAWIELSKDWLPKKERSLTAHFLYLYGL